MGRASLPPEGEWLTGVKPDAADPLDRGIRYLLSQQRPNGCWEGEMVWCTMILSQYVIVKRVTGHSFDEKAREKMVQYFRASRTSAGVWGMHPESKGYVFFTTLAYVALRLLGLPPADPLLATARSWLHRQDGGVLAIPSWGKFWLATLGLYEYSGVNPIPPEMFLLPKFLPFHPHRYYCHTRLIYLAMSYLYGVRFRADLGAIVSELREELYGRPYSRIQFSAHRHDLAPTDVYVRPTAWLRGANNALHLYERLVISPLRRRALNVCFERIVTEQRTSQFQGISPVNGLLNCLALWHRDPKHSNLNDSLAGMEKWKWEDETQGIRYVGARSNSWDTAFAMLALLESSDTAVKENETLIGAYGFLRRAQLTSELPGYRAQDRDPALGGWCFSDGAHRWPVSDCTAEALCAMLKMHAMPRVRQPAERISAERIGQAAEFILLRQNADGGFGTYERRRGSSWLETVNPSEMFGQCMTERSYVECTASSLSALAHVREAYPALWRDRLDGAIDRAIRFLRSRQREDGSYAGFWGINFTYAIFHVAKGLRAAGVAREDPVLARATQWLISKQRADGGWGEHYSGCLEHRYVEHAESQIVMTSWALLALMEVLGTGNPSVQQGIGWLRSMQRSDGSWPHQAVNGVFFGSAMLDYRLYSVYFPVWALNRFHAEGVKGEQRG
jgi:2,3-oxidosqualene cyclase